MLYVSYGRFTNDGIQGMIANPQNRAESVSKLLAPFGGKLIGYHMILNADFDFFIVSDVPQDKLAEITFITELLVRGSGAVESMTTVPALSAEDAVPQMRKAKEMAAAMTYEAPKKA